MKETPKMKRPGTVWGSRDRKKNEKFTHNCPAGFNIFTRIYGLLVD